MRTQYTPNILAFVQSFVDMFDREQVESFSAIDWIDRHLPLAKEIITKAREV